MQPANVNVQNSSTRRLASAVRSVVLSTAALTATQVHAEPRWDATLPGNITWNVTAADYPDADAVILRWEQHWQLEADGTVRRRERKWTRLLSPRAIRATADPRIDFHARNDQVEIHQAATRLADGTLLPVPEYGINISATRGIVGWPAYDGWRQQVVSFSGAAAGVTLILDYELVSQPGAPCRDFDLRLDDRFPIIERAVSVTTPTGQDFEAHTDHLAIANPHTSQSVPGGVRHLWMLDSIPARSIEPHAPDWRLNAPRLRWTTCPDAGQWVENWLRACSANEPVDPAIAEWVTETVKDEPAPLVQVRTVAKRLSSRFNLVESRLALRTVEKRAAADVFASNYGNTMEAGALWATAFRALGAEVDAFLLVDRRDWNPAVPTQSALDGIALQVRIDDSTQWWHPSHGQFGNPGRLRERALLRIGANGELVTSPIDARGANQPSNLRVTGRIKIDAEGEYAGDLRLDMTGAYFNPLSVETADDQKRWLRRWVAGVLEDGRVEEHSVELLTPDRFVAVATVKGETKALQGKSLRALFLGSTAATPADVTLPLDRPRRSSPVEIPSRFDARIRLHVDWDDAWTLATHPRTGPSVEGDWGGIEQSIKADDHGIKLDRQIRIDASAVAATDFNRLRTALNDLRTPGSRAIVIRPAGE